MVLPLLAIGAQAIRSNALERRALEALGASLARTRTYAEVETAMFNQSDLVWRALSGLDPDARREFALQGEVVAYWLARWEAELRPDEAALARGVRSVQDQIATVADSTFALVDAGRREEGYRLARRELRDRLFPALTELNHEIYRRAREYSVQRAFARVEEIVDTERRVLLAILALALVVGPLGSWWFARTITRPVTGLRAAMAVVGEGDLEHPIAAEGPAEIADLARAFTQMTGRLRASRADLERVNAALAAQVAEVERAQAQLVQSEKLASIGEMAAAVAHGMRNPLASLRAAAQFARRHPGSPAAAEQLDAMIGEVDRLERRISHLLTFARPAPFHPLRERPGALVAALQPSLGRLMAAREVMLAVDVPDDLPEVRVDPMQLEQAILEVASNAMDATPPGGRVALAARHDTARGEVVLAITDTGPGIAPEVLPRVTEPFFTTRPEGTGLGLAIARRFLEQNGGTLEVESAPGDGTTVRLRLPVAPAGDSAA